MPTTFSDSSHATDRCSNVSNSNSNSSNSNSSSSRALEDPLAQERERLRVAQKRLDLQRERLALDQQMLAAERKNFKANVKLASKNKKARQDELEYQVETLIDQIHDFRRKEEQWKSRDKEQTKRIVEAEVAIAKSSKEYNLRILALEKDLRDRTANAAEEQDKTRNRELEYQVNTLLDQIKDYRGREEQWKSREKEQIQRIAEAELATAALQKDLGGLAAAAAAPAPPAPPAAPAAPADTNNAADQDKTQQFELEREVKTLRNQMEDYRRKEEEWKSLEKQQTERITEAEVAVVECSKEHNIRILELEQDLRDLTAITANASEEDNRRRFELEQEVKTLQNQLVDYRRKEEEWKSREKEQAENIAAAEAAVLNLKIVDLEKDLRKAKNELAVSMETRAKEKEQWENEKLEIVESESFESANTADGSLSGEEFERLKRDWQRQKGSLEVQLRNQNQQIENWKLLLPRNKVLLEQTQSKNERLAKDLEEIQSKYNEQASSIVELERRLETMRQEQEEDEPQATPDEDGTAMVVSKNDSDETVDSITQNTLPFVRVATILIPSDLTHEEIKELEKKFVIEWEWSNGQNKLGGIYTGWFDLKGNPSGFGTLRIDDGSIYMGEWKDGLRNGFGFYASDEGALYSGSWINDRFQGRGVHVSPGNEIYTGDWVDGMKQGIGIETSTDQARYIGRYYQDQRNGEGCYTSPDGKVDEGMFEDGVFKDDGQRNTRASQSPPNGPALSIIEWSSGRFVGS